MSVFKNRQRTLCAPLSALCPLIAMSLMGCGAADEGTANATPSVEATGTDVPSASGMPAAPGANTNGTPGAPSVVATSTSPTTSTAPPPVSVAPIDPGPPPSNTVPVPTPTDTSMTPGAAGGPTGPVGQGGQEPGLGGSGNVDQGGAGAEMGGMGGAGPGTGGSPGGAGAPPDDGVINLVDFAIPTLEANQQCSYCHGLEGEGSPLGPEIQHPIEDYATWVVRNGREHPDYPEAMPDYGEDVVSGELLGEIFGYLAGLPQPTTGEGLYVDYCGNCHGGDATGGVTDRPINTEPASEIMAHVRAGAHPGEFENRREHMHAYTQDELSDDEVNLIADYIGSL